MADELSKPASLLTRKVGPFPMWVLMGVGAAGIVYALAKARGKSTSPTAPSTAPPQSDLGSAAGGDGGGSGGGSGYFTWGGQAAFAQCPNGEIVSDPSLCGSNPGNPPGNPPPGTPPPATGFCSTAPAVFADICASFASLTNPQRSGNVFYNLAPPQAWQGWHDYLATQNPELARAFIFWAERGEFGAHAPDWYTQFMQQQTSGSSNAPNAPLSDTTANGSNGPQSTNADMSAVTSTVLLPAHTRPPLIPQTGNGGQLAGASVY